MKISNKAYKGCFILSIFAFLEIISLRLFLENTGNALEEDTYESVPYTVIENFGVTF